jgi:hypothetical protein
MVVARGAWREHIPRQLAVVSACCLGMLVLVGITPIKADSAPRHVRTTFREHRLVANGAHPASRGAAGATVTTTTTPAGLDSFQVGYDYTQNSHLPSFAGGDPTAVASAKSLLTSMATFQNAFLMGWGTDDPEPYPGTFAWSSLDSSVEVMGSTVPASRRMITLASAPGWMKVGGASQEWNMNAAVDPSHFQDFANLAADVAQRYDGTHIGANGQLLPRVDYFDVWNELKGFWTSSGDTWNYQSYTEMYNDVYKAIKAVRPDALVGGPYAPVGAATAADIADPSSIQGAFGVVDQRSLDVITYWLQHKVGAQFMSMAGGPASTAESPFASGQYFVAVAHWLRGLNSQTYPGASTLPIIWAEFYPGLSSATGVATGREAVAVDVSTAIEAGVAGVNYMLVWEMEGDASPTLGEGVWTDAAKPLGGRPTALYGALADLSAFFPPGTPLYCAIATGPVSAIASRNVVLLVSESRGPLTVRVNQTRVHLDPYEVTVVPST